MSGRFIATVVSGGDVMSRSTEMEGAPLLVEAKIAHNFRNVIAALGIAQEGVRSVDATKRRSKERGLPRRDQEVCSVVDARVAIGRSVFDRERARDAVSKFRSISE